MNQNDDTKPKTIVLRGRSISSVNQAQGYAVVLDMDDEGNILNISKTQEGCVAVVPWASPNLSLIVKRCAAVIAEKGGILSHGAIQVREGKKCGIFNVSSATNLIRDGDFVVIDNESVIVSRNIK